MPADAREVWAGLSLLCITFGLVQLVLLLGMGWREGRRARRDEGVDGAADGIQAVYALVPALDEEAVIGATVTELLLQDPRVHVVVVDDASVDGTAQAALACGGARVTVCRRGLPFARQGKGPALNAGLAAIRNLVADRDQDPSRVVVLVMDADGRLSPDALTPVLPLFADDQVGGVQLGVRIRNRATNLLTLIQDCEFWGVAAVGQMGRVRTGTVSLGGNGQFTRLTALDDLGRRPWTDALTEDLDLAVQLLVVGWRLTSTPRAWVDQQGLDRLAPLLRQRTRWFQGHMTTAIRRLREVWTTPRLSAGAVLEVTSYLLIPFVLVLPWSVLAQVGLWYAVSDLAAGRLGAGGTTGAGRVVGLVAWYVISLTPTVACGVLYARRQQQVGIWRAVAFSHVLMAWNYVMFVACWRSVGRMVLGRTSWEKTARLGEPGRETSANADPVIGPSR